MGGGGGWYKKVFVEKEKKKIGNEVNIVKDNFIIVRLYYLLGKG